MSSYPMSYIALVTRNRLAEMLAPTYGAIRNVDLNESWQRLDDALRDLRLIEAVQAATWVALQELRPELEPTTLIAKAQKTLDKRKTWKPATRRRKDEGAWIALSVRIDEAAGLASSEALSLLDTDDGQDLLDRGLDLLGAHLASQMIR